MWTNSCYNYSQHSMQNNRGKKKTKKLILLQLLPGDFSAKDNAYPIQIWMGTCDLLVMGKLWNSSASSQSQREREICETQIDEKMERRSYGILGWRASRQGTRGATGWSKHGEEIRTFGCGRVFSVPTRAHGGWVEGAWSCPWVSDTSRYEEDSLHLDAFLFSFSIRHVTASVIKMIFF